MIYSGDEYYDDDITSGIDSSETEECPDDRDPAGGDDPEPEDYE